MPQGTHGTHSKRRAWHGLKEARMARTQRGTHGTHSKRRSGSKQVWEQAASGHPRLWLTLTNMAHHTRGTTIAHHTDTTHEGRTHTGSKRYDESYSVGTDATKRDDATKRESRSLASLSASKASKSSKSKESKSVESKSSRKEMEASGTFEVMLDEIITSTRLHWKEARSLLRKDSRYDACADVLSSDEREGLWEAHVAALERALIVRLQEALSGMDDVSFAADWERVWTRVKELDHRFGDLRSKTRDKTWHSWALSARASSRSSLVPLAVLHVTCPHSARDKHPHHNFLVPPPHH